MDPNATIRINITIPKNIWSELEKEVPERGKSSFVADAIEEKLRVKKRLRAFADLDSLPPTFNSIGNGNEYIHTLRTKEDEERNGHLHS